MKSGCLSVGQIGVGGFGEERRRRLRETGLFEVVALCDWDQGALERAAAEENAFVCDSYGELLGRPGLDAVIICTGAKFHAEQIVLALEQGLPVFVEKPLCATREEMYRINDVQGRVGLPVGVGHIDHTGLAISKTIKSLIEAESFGEITAFEMTTAHGGGLRITQDDWRGDPERNPGGMLFQCGVHALHELMFYFGPIEEVSARMRYDVHSTKTADAALCHLLFASGVVGTLCAYHVTPYRHTLSIFGTGANLYRDNRYFDEGVKLMEQRIRADGGYEKLEMVEVHHEDVANGDLKSFYRAVCSGEAQYPSLVDGSRAVATVFAAEESALSQKTIKIGFS